MSKRSPHSLYIINLGDLFSWIEVEIAGTVREIKLSKERINDVVDWIILEYLNQYLKEQIRTRLSSHWVDDDGKSCIRLMSPSVKRHLYTIFRHRIGHFDSGVITALVSGENLIISKELKIHAGQYQKSCATV